MPRANRYFLPGHVWHITHRCHKKEFLLKFAKDRENWIHWLFAARKRYGLCVLNYMVTSNHIHLLVKDTGNDAIPNSMQLIAGRTAQAYNQRKGRKGAFWEDRYHATAVQTDEHFIRCLVYIDLNMVRAGVVRHPENWPHCGYHEIQHPRARYRIIDHSSLLALTQFDTYAVLTKLHQEWITDEIKHDRASYRDERWTQGLAVGQREFIERIQNELGYRARTRECIALDEGYELKEPSALYRAFSS
jgi:putative transposase